METTIISLKDFNNVKPISYFWICGVGCPAGQDFAFDEDERDAGDYANLIDEMDLWDLDGEGIDGQWVWDGKGDVLDVRGNTIYNVKAH